MKKSPAMHILIAIIIPIFIITTGMRVALSPLFFNLEYRLPNFPPDEYGFTLNDRLKWADFSIDFITGKIDADTYAAAQLADGQSLFNERELSHMIDVRELTLIMLWVWRALLFLIVIAFLPFMVNKQKEPPLKPLAVGAKITIAFIAAILIFLIINFNQLFTSFHQIFFEGDTWLFYHTDSLIRLFPIKFWQDLFIFIGAFSLLLSAGFIYLDKKVRNLS